MKRIFLLLLTSLLVFVFISCSGDDCPDCPQLAAIVNLDKHLINFGANETTATFKISNKGDKTLTWDLTVNNGSWLDLSSTGGSNDVTITVTANRNLLPEIGSFKATIIINSNAANNTTDSIVVHILNSGEWLLTDNGAFDQCVEVDEFDYYWVKKFDNNTSKPAIFIDSIAIFFCDTENMELIQLLVLSAQFDDSAGFYFPNDFLEVGDPITPLANMNSYPIDVYLNTSPFYVGYFQQGLTTPQPGIDNTTGEVNGSWVASDVNEDPENPNLFWFYEETLQTLAIRVFITPVIQYNPKMVRQYEDGYLENKLRTGFAARGVYPMSVKPKLKR